MTTSESLSSVAATGDRVATLKTLRDVLAEQIETTDSARDVAALSRQLTDVLAQIATLEPETKAVDPVDEIARRRAARGAGSAAGAGRAAGRPV